MDLKVQALVTGGLILVPGLNALHSAKQASSTAASGCTRLAAIL